MSASDMKMNCEQYQEAIGADPQAMTEDVAAHVSACDACSAFHADMVALDARIKGALEIDTPALSVPDLPPVEDDNVVSLPVRGRGGLRAPAWLAIAASFALAAVIGVQLTGNDTSGMTLSEEILAHLDHEPWALRVTDEAVSDARFGRVVNADIGTMDRDVGLITYAQSCIINGKTIPHLVMQGKNGPITLLLMPDEPVDGAMTIDGDAVNGVILPHGKGSIAIIGERGEALGEIEQRVKDSVEWSI